VPLRYEDDQEDDDSEFGRIRKSGFLLDDLLSRIRNNDITIDEAVESGRTALASVDSRHPLMSSFFEHFGKILDSIKHLIAQGRSNTLTSRLPHAYPVSQIKRFGIRHRLIQSLLMRNLYISGHSTQAYFETRRGNTVSRKICESAPVCGEETAGEETDHAGEMGKFRSLSYGA
jgi:hypothetical protein